MQRIIPRRNPSAWLGHAAVRPTVRFNAFIGVSSRFLGQGLREDRGAHVITSLPSPLGGLHNTLRVTFSSCYVKARKISTCAKWSACNLNHQSRSIVTAFMNLAGSYRPRNVRRFGTMPLHLCWKPQSGQH